MELEQANWLIHEGQSLLQAGSEASGLRLKSWQANVLREQVDLRRRAAIRFPDPSKWLWTTRSLAQSSDWWCAKYKATLFPSKSIVTDGCCGAGVDMVALALRGAATGIDRDPTLVALANANLAAHGLPETVVEGELPKNYADQLTGDSHWLHLDPDRRAPDSMERRLRKSEDFSPTLSESIEMLSRASGGVSKLAPASIIDSQLERELRENLGLKRCWLGNLGECRQQLLITGELVNGPACHVKTSSLEHSDLRSAVLCEPDAEPVILSGRFQDTCSGELTPQRYIYDCHSVLHAAQLQMEWAASVSALPLGTSQGYFTSDTAVDSPWSQRFEVVDVLAWDQRRVKRWLREHRIGEVEVKKRLLQLDANEHQRQLRGAGEDKITLMITRLGDRVRAIMARRV